MAQGLLNRCLSCGLELNRAFLVVDGKCRFCDMEKEFTKPIPWKLPAAPKWAPTPNPKAEPGTNIWWTYRNGKWIPLPPYEYPNQLITWLK